MKSISNNLAKMAINRQKIGQMSLWRMDINGHNLVIFHPILNLFFLKCLFFKDKSNGDKTT